MERGSNVVEVEKKSDFSEKLYITAVLIALSKALINFSSIINVPGILISLCDLAFMGLMAVKLCYQRYSRRNMFIIVMLLVCCAFTYLSVPYYYLLISFFCIVAAQDIDMRKLFGITSYVKFGYLIFHTVCYIFALIFAPGTIEFTYRYGKLRHNFFMGHSNTFAMFITWASLEYIYAHREKLTNKRLVFFWIINFLSYVFTDSNTGLIVITMVILLLLCDRWKLKKIFKVMTEVNKYGFLFCTAFFCGLTVVYSKLSGALMQLYLALDSFFTGRMLMGEMIYDISGWTLFGKYVNIPETVPGKYYWNGYWFDDVGCDNTYIWFFVSYGTIYLILIGLGFYYSAKRADNVELICMFAYIFYAVMEAYVINAVFCFPLFFVGKYLFYDEVKVKGRPNTYRRRTLKQLVEGKQIEDQKRKNEDKDFIEDI